jgi:hypothetical protein
MKVRTNSALAVGLISALADSRAHLDVLFRSLIVGSSYSPFRIRMTARDQSVSPQRDGHNRRSYVTTRKARTSSERLTGPQLSSMMLPSSAEFVRII